MDLFRLEYATRLSHALSSEKCDQLQMLLRELVTNDPVFDHAYIGELQIALQDVKEI